MMLSGRPLLGTKADQRYVVPRPELPILVRSLAQRLNTALFGAPGSGKTTLLRQAARMLEDEGIHVAYVNAARVDAPLEALLAAHDALSGERLPLTFAMGNATQAFTAQPADQVRDPALRVVRALRQKQPTVVMIDGLHPGAAHPLFGQMRDELWETGITWALAGDVDQRAGYLARPADAFFERVIVLPRLTEGQQEELIRKRCEDGDPDWVLRVRAPSGTPRSLLAVLREAQLNSEDDSRGLLAARAAREKRAAQRGRLHSLILAEIEDGASVSASDKDLLQRFGISRQRAQQVLMDLEKEGLVNSGTLTNSESGRPRKVYWTIGASS